MSSSRDTVLGRIRAAVADDRPADPIPRDYQRRGSLPPGSDGVIELFMDRLIDYRAGVRRSRPEQLGSDVDRALTTARSVVVPIGLRVDFVAACGLSGRTVIVDGEPTELSALELDAIDAVVTQATVAIGINGTIILDGREGQGRRAISLIPDLHVIILSAEQIVETVIEALARIEPTRPITMIAGPSATSDIELSRVEGVHGPRTLNVVIA